MGRLIFYDIFHLHFTLFFFHADHLELNLLVVKLNDNLIFTKVYFSFFFLKDFVYLPH